MDLKLRDKTVLVTGASGGIGRAIALAFAEEGARVALHANRRVNTLEDWVATRDWSHRGLVVRGDVRSPTAMFQVVDRILDQWSRLDICVANAGVWYGEPLNLHHLPEDRIREVIDVNLLGSLWTARAFLEGLARTGPHSGGEGASLLFIGSTAGRFGERGHAAYAASKAGLYGLVKTLKNEITEIDPCGRVNMVEPGWTVTNMTRSALDNTGMVTGALQTMAVRQLAHPRDIAAAVVTMASGATARHVSGEILTVAGGMEGRLLWQENQVDVEGIRNTDPGEPS